ncbi:EAL domain-containing protein [Cytobacillus sp. Hz8]|uniref:EAL domain-containing protein n=1 Tax=Cytobacillus sp. Hz8 TaxID=3347168 RepID=UPI0035DCA466
MEFLDKFFKNQSLQANDSGIFRALFIRNPQPIFVFNLDKQIISINQKLKELLGYSLNDVVRLKNKWFPDGDSDLFQYHFHNALNGIPTVFESTLLHKNGQSFPVELSLIPSMKEDETEVVFAVCQDQTTLKDYENKLGRVFNSLEQAERISSIGSFEYDVASQQAIWSKQVYDIFGINDSNFVPKLDTVRSFVHPQDVEKYDMGLKQLVESHHNYHLEHRIIRMDGEERMILICFDALFDEVGQVAKVIGVIQDITEKKEMENRLAESREQFLSVANHLHAGIWSIDRRDSHFTFYSKGVQEIIGVSPSILNENPAQLIEMVHPKDRSIIEEGRKKLKDGEEINQQLRIIDKNGRTKWISLQTIPYLDDDRNLIRMDGIVQDITREKESVEVYTNLVDYDYLTRLPNRNYFYQILDQRINQSKKDHKSFAVFYLDLDRFNYINDTLGGEIGDRLLISFSKRLNQLLDKRSFLARIAGDEFVICIEANHQVEETLEVARKIIKEMELPFFVDEYELFTTVSIGISSYPIDGTDSYTLLKKAIQALKKVKELGRNDWQVFSSSMSIESFRLFQLERDMRKAIFNHEFYIEYQPKVDTRSGRIEGAEALIRWEHPDWGIVSPNEFIPLAEENGMVFKMGDLVLQKVCLLLKAWKEEGVPVVPISVNLSPKRLLKVNFVEDVQEIIKSAGIDPSLIEFELTEYAFIKNLESTKSIISRLKEFGVKFALDDFGTGYSSLSYLMKLDIDTLKIDKSFIDGIGLNTKNEGIIKSALFLSKELNMKVVAEGVENQQQLNFLLQQECAQIQGYIFSKPVKADQFKKFLRKGIIQALPTKRSTHSVENRRKYYRLGFVFPLSADMIVIKFKNKNLQLGKSKSLIEDISLGGLKYLSSINLPIQHDLILQFTTTILDKEMSFIGRNVWKEEVDGLFQYGFKFSMSVSEKNQFAAILNQLTLQLRSNSILPSCSFFQGSKKEYF